MVVVHHLNNSRSQRILWLLEELGAPYEIAFHQRDATTGLAPAELKAVHPLGKSPAITDQGHTIAESGAIIDYLIRKYGQGRFAPDVDTPEHEAYLQWLHYAEGSAMLPLMLRFYTLRLGDAAAPLTDRIDGEIDNHLAYFDQALEGRPYLMGKDLTGADVQMSFVGEVGRALGRLDKFPNVAAWVERTHARPAYKRALEKGGAYSMA